MATIEESIQAMIPQLTEEVAAKIRNRCLENLSFEVSKQVQLVVSKHIEEVILPAVRADLDAHEAEIKASVIAAIKQLFTAVGERLVDAAKSKLTSYEGDKLLAQMMGPLLRGY